MTSPPHPSRPEGCPRVSTGNNPLDDETLAVVCALCARRLPTATDSDPRETLRLAFIRKMDEVRVHAAVERFYRDLGL